ncbi:threonine/serine dehydratase [Sulfitobacter aestuarii]|uniref:Threonine/serine dehydratase n=1 Tax=Sulfitobacter aestuarii TaxID=2161676 RepID=A0ABW5U4Q3_9RHOB
MIRAAAARLEGHARLTPLLSSPFLDEIAGRQVWVKPECLQHTGSFKFRGGYAAISALEPQIRARGVIAYSSGNHAQGVALAAKMHGIEAVIVMPQDTPRLKIANTRAFGAEVVLYDRENEDRGAIGREIAETRGLSLIKPFDEPEVIAGQGSTGLEIARQARALGITQADVIVCCGGGGLSSGVALALEAEAPGLRVRTAEPEFYDDTARSLQSGWIESNARRGNALCDAIVTPQPGDLTFPILKRLAGAGLVVSDDEVLQAMGHAFNWLKLVAEPGGAVALAAALFRANEIEGDAVIVTITGGNVDPGIFARALDRLR